MKSTTWRLSLVIISLILPSLLDAFHPMESGMRASKKSSGPPSSSKDGGPTDEGREGYLKYLLENAQEGNENQIQGIKGIDGYDYLNLDANAGDVDKRRNSMDFLRFGRSGNPLLSSALDLNTAADGGLLTSGEKRAPRNFLRFGRAPGRNFLRFGKSNGPLEMAMGLENELTESEEKRARNFLRFGRKPPPTFLRFGRAQGRNFLRFGRSASNYDEQKTTENSPKLVSQKTSQNTRSKRSPSLYDDAMFLSQAPLSWPSDLGSYVLGKSEPIGYNNHHSAADALIPSSDKRASHPRNFVRYGRDPLDFHFLRFGKRSSIKEYPEEEPDNTNWTDEDNLKLNYPMLD